MYALCRCCARLILAVIYRLHVHSNSPALELIFCVACPAGNKISTVANTAWGRPGTHLVEGLLEAAAAGEAGVPEPRPKQRRDAAEPEIRHLHDAVPCRNLQTLSIVCFGHAREPPSQQLISITERTPDDVQGLWSCTQKGGITAGERARVGKSCLRDGGLAGMHPADEQVGRLQVAVDHHRPAGTASAAGVITGQRHCKSSVRSLQRQLLLQAACLPTTVSHRTVPSAA